MPSFTIDYHNGNKETAEYEDIIEVIQNIVNEVSEVLTELSILDEKYEKVFYYNQAAGPSLQDFIYLLSETSHDDIYDIDDDMEEYEPISIDYCDYSYVFDYEMNSLVTSAIAHTHPEAHYIVSYSDGSSEVLKDIGLDYVKAYVFNDLRNEKNVISSLLPEGFTSNKDEISHFSVKTLNGSVVLEVDEKQFKIEKKRSEKIIDITPSNNLYHFTIEHENGTKESIQEQDIMSALLYGIINSDNSQKLINITDNHDNLLVTLDKKHSNDEIMYFDASMSCFVPYYTSDVSQNIQEFRENVIETMGLEERLIVVNFGTHVFYGALINRQMYNNQSDLVSDE